MSSKVDCSRCRLMKRFPWLLPLVAIIMILWQGPAPAYGATPRALSARLITSAPGLLNIVWTLYLAPQGSGDSDDDGLVDDIDPDDDGDGIVDELDTDKDNDGIPDSYDDGDVDDDGVTDQADQDDLFEDAQLNGNSLTLATRMGEPGLPTAMVVVDVSGVPTFSLVGAASTFDATGSFVLSMQVPSLPDLSGLVISIDSFAVNPLGDVIQSAVGNAVFTLP